LDVRLKEAESRMKELQTRLEKDSADKLHKLLGEALEQLVPTWYYQ
jgi:hypothetical protein